MSQKSKNVSNVSKCDLAGNTESRSRNWFFTLNNYNENDIDCLKCLPNCEYLFQEELGENGTKHLQGVMLFKNQKRFKTIKNLFPRMHLEVMKKRTAIDYCCKDDTRNGMIYTNMSKYKPKRTLITKYRDWQLELILAMKNTNNREIIWVCDLKGNSGKTWFARHWYRMHPNTTMYINGKASDMKYSLSELYHEENREMEYIFMGIPRTKENFVSYQGIEEIKDGFFYSTKYKSKLVDYNKNPVFVVLANFYPDKNALSKDRWKIITI